VKVAYLSPMPPEKSGIADYSALLVPALGRRADLTVVKRGAKRPPRATDVALYHIGNDPRAHGWILDALRRSPGVVVLHDFVLHHLISGTTLGRGDASAYLDALERGGGLVARLLGHAVVEKRIPPLWESRPEDFPLVGEVLDRATGLVVHSRYVERRVRELGYERPIHVVPHPAWPTPSIEPASVPGAPLIGCFGNVNASKRIPQLLDAFARLREAVPEARLLLVGAVSPGFDLDRRLQRLGLSEEGVVREAYVGEERLWSLMAACDVCVNLRSPTMGETSGSVIRQLSLGKPVVVSDVGWFAELPDAVALKVPVDEHETATLYAALELLARDPGIRSAMSAASLELARDEHDLERVADRYAAALERVAGGEAVADSVLGDVATAATEVGIEPGSPEAVELARRLAEVELGR
jgi:glycosyltransferase involved in cell wall biosynthesis